ncbi:dihydrofolate reductase family protein [Parvibaculum sp.]|jgi:dihydrofolate reductase|uniref:dihydrofolate reductase family protein n=1 Tax=Parvibaculum sp. TaxID=2024848 RepID=UPI002FDA8152
MQPLRYSINVTLDGCCDHEAGIPNEALHAHAAEGIAAADALLFGRVIYEMMEEAWRPVAETGERPDWMPEWMVPFARTIHAAKKYVVSDTLKTVDWNAELVRGPDLEKTVRRLKQQPGRGLATGGVTLPLALAERGLIDEYEFIVHPRIAGHGPSPFAGLSTYLDLKLTGRKELASGAVALRYTA